MKETKLTCIGSVTGLKGTEALLASPGYGDVGSNRGWARGQEGFPRRLCS